MMNMDHKLKIAFFGTPSFVCEILDSLSSNDLKPFIVITGEDKQVGRKLVITPPEPKTWAIENSVNFLQPKKLDVEFIEYMRQQKFDLFVVVAYGKILPEELINLPAYGTINVHYSLLPLYRGATPVESTLLNGDNKTGVSIQHMVYELDAGDILNSFQIDILPNENHEELRDRLNKTCLPLLIDTIQNISERIKNKQQQEHTQKTICKKIKKEDGLVTLLEDPVLLWRKYRAYWGWPGLYFFQQKKDLRVRVKITKATFENNKFTIQKVTPEGRKEISYEEFLNWIKAN